MSCNKIMGIDVGANGEWLAKMGSFGTEVGWCLSGRMSGESSERRGVRWVS